MSERIVIDTPENIAFGYDVAGLGSRFLAALVDSLIQGSIYIFLAIVLILVSFQSALANLPPEITLLLTPLFILAIFLIWFGYYILFEIFMNGQTPGKRLLNLRVIKENGQPFGAVDSFVRNIVRLFDFLPFGYGVGVIVMFLNARSKRLGDFAAGTLVVNVHEAVKLRDLQTQSARAVASPQSAHSSRPFLARPMHIGAVAPVVEIAGLENLRPSDIQLIEEYLLRRPALTNGENLGARIAVQIRSRLGGGEPNTSQERPDVFLQQVLRAYRDLHDKR